MTEEVAVQGNYRKTLIRSVTFLAGVYFFFEFLLPASILDAIGVGDYHSEISNGFVVVGAMAIGLGIINLFRVHGTRVAFRRKDWFFSLTLLVGLILMSIVMVFDWVAGRRVTEQALQYRTLGEFAEVIVKDVGDKKQGVPERSFRVGKLVEASHDLQKGTVQIVARLDQELHPELPELEQIQFRTLSSEISDLLEKIGETNSDDLEADETLEKFGKQLTVTGVTFEKILRIEYDRSQIKKVFLFLFEGLFVSLGSAMFSLLGVYIASAAYRAFRVKSIESFLMMSAAVVVMLGQIPFYEYISLELPAIRQWLLEIPNSAAFRAIKIGASIAGLIMAFRMWFSIESESFSPRGGGKE